MLAAASCARWDGINPPSCVTHTVSWDRVSNVHWYCPNKIDGPKEADFLQYLTSAVVMGLGISSRALEEASACPEILGKRAKKFKIPILSICLDL